VHLGGAPNEKAPLSGASFELPSLVAAMPIASAAASEIQTDTWTMAAVVPPVMMMAVPARVNFFYRRCSAITCEPSQT
jgi:hypothetical protein